MTNAALCSQLTELARRISLGDDLEPTQAKACLDAVQAILNLQEGFETLYSSLQATQLALARCMKVRSPADVP